MIEYTDPTQSDVRPLEPDDIDEPLPGDDALPDPDGEAVVVPGQRPGPTEPVPMSGRRSSRRVQSVARV